MKRYTDNDTGKRIVEVHDLSFLSDRDHRYGWLKRHCLHFRLKCALKRADRILVTDAVTGVNLVRYYFVPKEKIVVNTFLESLSDKA